MTKLPFNNFMTARERREELLRSGQGATFSQWGTDTDEDEHHLKDTPRHRVGSTPVPQYPKGPNWSEDPVPPEPPLGYDINQMEPVGTPKEIAASLGEANSGEGLPPNTSLVQFARLSGDGSAPMPFSASSEAAPSPASNDDDPPPDAA